MAGAAHGRSNELILLQETKDFINFAVILAKLLTKESLADAEALGERHLAERRKRGGILGELWS